jgi:hypothetical protein
MIVHVRFIGSSDLTLDPSATLLQPPSKFSQSNLDVNGAFLASKNT